MNGLRGSVISLTLAVLLALAPGSSLAQAATPPTAVDVAELVQPPNVPAYGLTDEARAARHSHWLHSLQMPVNPVADPTGEHCGHGLERSVFFLTPSSLERGERICTVPTGMALLIPLLHEACSTVTPMSFLARDGPELWTCTEPQFPRRAELTAVIDGVGLTALERYRFPAEHFTMALTEDNWAEAGPAVLEGIYGGSWLLLAPLPPGEHELRFSASLPHIGAFYEVTYHLTVANPTVVENRVGSPEVRPNPSATGTGTRVGSGRLLEEEQGTGFKNPRDLRGSTTWAWSSRC